MCFIIAKRLETMSAPLRIVESTVFLMFLLQDNVFTILYHGGLHTKFYIIAIQGVDSANQIMCLFNMKKQGQRLKYISLTKRQNIKIVFYITLVPTLTTIIYHKICLALKILRVHHLHGLHQHESQLDELPNTPRKYPYKILASVVLTLMKS